MLLVHRVFNKVKKSCGSIITTWFDIPPLKQWVVGLTRARTYEVFRNLLFLIYGERKHREETCIDQFNDVFKVPFRTGCMWELQLNLSL